jgi:hypothetical protein
MRTLVVAALALAVAAPASAADLPKRKSGLWDLKMSAAGTPGGAQTMQMCIDEKTDNAAQQSAGAMGKEACTKQDIRREAGRMVVESVCKFGESTATTRSVFTGSFDSAYKVDIKSTYDPPLAGMKEGGTVIEAKWLGPCKPDQKPGDVILANGMKINMNDAKAK